MMVTSSDEPWEVGPMQKWNLLIPCVKLNKEVVIKIMHYAHIICMKRGSALDTHSNDFICTYIERVTSSKQKNHFVSRCEGWGWCSWLRESCWCTTVSFLGYVYHAINEHQCSMLPLACVLTYLYILYYITRVLYFTPWGVNWRSCSLLNDMQMTKCAQYKLDIIYGWQVQSYMYTTARFFILRSCLPFPQPHCLWWVGHSQLVHPVDSVSPDPGQYLQTLT